MPARGKQRKAMKSNGSQCTNEKIRHTEYKKGQANGLPSL